MISLPIFRAFSETFDKYILGVTYFSDAKYYMLVDDCNKNDNVGTGSFPIDPTTLAIHFPDSINTNSEKVWYNMEEISNIVKEYENGKVETN